MVARGTSADAYGAQRQAVDKNGDGSWLPARLAAYTLLSKAVALNPNDPGLGPLRGGRYAFRIIAANWAGLTATLQSQEMDGTWTTVTKADNSAAAFTANGTLVVDVAQDTTMRVLLTGAINAAANVYANLGGIS